MCSSYSVDWRRPALDKETNARLRVALDKIMRQERLYVLSGRHLLKPGEPNYKKYDDLESMAEELEADL